MNGIGSLAIAYDEPGEDAQGGPGQGVVLSPGQNCSVSITWIN